MRLVLRVLLLLVCATFAFEYMGESLKSDCETEDAVAKRQVFEERWARWAERQMQWRGAHADATARFVHVGLPHKSSLLNRLKVVAASAVMSLISDRVLLVSWKQHLDLESIYRYHLSFHDLFLPPEGLDSHADIAYDVEWVKGLPAFDRFNITGFGMERYIEQEPLHELMCSDFMTDMKDVRWWEVPWRYGWFASLLYQNPFPAVRQPTRAMLTQDDMFGWVGRKLFRPVPRIWRKIEHFRKHHFTGGPTAESVAGGIVGIELHGDVKQLQRMLQAIDQDLVKHITTLFAPRKSKEQMQKLEARNHMTKEERKASGLPLWRFPSLRVFVVVRNHEVMRSVVDKYGHGAIVSDEQEGVVRSQLMYYPHKNFTRPGDDGELIDLWLLQYCDVIYTSPESVSAVGALLSKRTRMVLTNSKQVVPEPQCAPCLNLHGVEKTTCFDAKLMSWPKREYKCTREYPIF